MSTRNTFYSCHPSFTLHICMCALYVCNNLQPFFIAPFLCGTDLYLLPHSCTVPHRFSSFYLSSFAHCFYFTSSVSYSYPPWHFSSIPIGYPFRMSDNTYLPVNSSNFIKTLGNFVSWLINSLHSLISILPVKCSHIFYLFDFGNENNLGALFHLIAPWLVLLLPFHLTAAILIFFLSSTV